MRNNISNLLRTTLGKEIKPGQIVFLKSNPVIRGAVVSIMPGKPENRYSVFINGETRIFYASQIQAEDRKDKDSIVLPCHKFHSYLTALQIQHPGLSTLYSLNAARVDFIPYQFRPVLKFIRSDRPRLLIADGVGVGKTIEAGLILRELQARRDVRSVLIVCPRPLVTERKWQIEMKRFEERFAHLDGRTLRFCINEMDLEGVWPEQYQKAIIPYSLFDEALLYGTGPDGRRRRRKGLLDLDPPPRFDLVIVDEAHHIRNSNTYSHSAVRFFCDHAEAVIFLTATPVQMGSNDLFVLLNVLRPDLIIDQESFAHMAEPNPFINRAVDLARGQGAGWAEKASESLNEAAATSWALSLDTKLSKSQEHREGLEPSSPQYESGVFAARSPVLVVQVGPEGLEPSHGEVKSRTMLPLTPQSRRLSRRGGSRTHDLRLIRTPLSPLSYAPAVRVGPEGFEPTPTWLKARDAAVTPRPYARSGVSVSIDEIGRASCRERA